MPALESARRDDLRRSDPAGDHLERQRASDRTRSEPAEGQEGAARQVRENAWRTAGAARAQPAVLRRTRTVAATDQPPRRPHARDRRTLPHASDGERPAAGAVQTQTRPAADD